MNAVIVRCCIKSLLELYTVNYRRFILSPLRLVDQDYKEAGQEYACS